MSKIVGVYGTLKKGYSNHRLLKDSKFLGSLWSKELFTMYSMGRFPALTKRQNNSVYFEIYEVDEDTLENIYRLEGYSGTRNSESNWYDTMDIETEWGKAEIFYFKTPFINNPIVESGRW